MGLMYPRPVALSLGGDKQNQGDGTAQRIVQTLSNPRAGCHRTRDFLFLVYFTIAMRRSDS